jgi:hypothetical protein
MIRFRQAKRPQICSVLLYFIISAAFLYGGHERNVAAVDFNHYFSGSKELEDVRTTVDVSSLGAPVSFRGMDFLRGRTNQTGALVIGLLSSDKDYSTCSRIFARTPQDCADGRVDCMNADVQIDHIIAGRCILLHRALSVAIWTAGPSALNAAIASINQIRAEIPELAHELDLSLGFRNDSDSNGNGNSNGNVRGKVKGFGVLLFDFPGRPYQFTEIPTKVIEPNPLGVRRWLEKRDSIALRFTLPESESGRLDAPVELRWAHAAGNMQIANLAEGGGHLVLYPGEVEVQYSRAGQVFVVLDTMDPHRSVSVQGDNGFVSRRRGVRGDADTDTDKDTEVDMDLRTSEEYKALPFHMIRACIVVPLVDPASLHDGWLEVDLVQQAILQSQPQSLSSSLSYSQNQNQNRGHSQIQSLGQSQQHISTKERETRWKRLLLQYWAEQRITDLWVNQWALPSLLPKSSLTDSTVTVGTAAIAEELLGLTPWRIFDLPDFLLRNLQDAYSDSQRSGEARDEGLISTVFNQLDVRTGYAPLPPSLLDDLVDIVIQETAIWLEMNESDLQVTGSYGLREYRKGATIKWHVDPADTQPITAIIHVADEGCAKIIPRSMVEVAAESGDELLKTASIPVSASSSTSVASSGQKRNSAVCDWPLHLPRMRSIDAKSFYGGGVVQRPRKSVPLSKEEGEQRYGESGNRNGNNGTEFVTKVSSNPINHSAPSSSSSSSSSSLAENDSLRSVYKSFSAKNKKDEQNLHLEDIEEASGALLEHIYLAPGQVLLLESARVPHARLVPLQADSYANAFVHLAPIGWENRARRILNGQ